MPDPIEEINRFSPFTSHELARLLLEHDDVQVSISGSFMIALEAAELGETTEATPPFMKLGDVYLSLDPMYGGDWDGHGEEEPD